MDGCLKKGMNLTGDSQALVLFLAGAIGLVGLLLALRALFKIQDLNREIRALKMQITQLESGLELMKLEREVIPKSPVSVRPSVSRGKKKQTEKQNPSDSPLRRTSDADPVVAVAATVPILTRTSRSSIKTIDTWTGERRWNDAEVEALLKSYRRGLTVMQLAVELGVDSKDVVCKIAREAFDCRGDLGEVSLAANDRKAWTTNSRNRAGKMINEGVAISAIAQEYGRTQMAIVWQAIDNRFFRK
jgi:hypothetical protein